MGFLPFLKIIFFNQLKNKASSVGSILGVIIAIAFITGTFMTSEAIVSDLFASELEELKTHFTAYSYYDIIQSEADSRKVMEELRDLDGIRSAGLITEMYADLYLNNSYINIMSGDPQGLSTYIGIDIKIPEEKNYTLLSRGLAERNDLEVGDEYNLTIERNVVWIDEYYIDGKLLHIPEGSDEEDLQNEDYGPHYYNFSMIVGGIIDDSSTPSGDMIYRYRGDFIIMNLETLEDLEADIRSIPDVWTSTWSQIYITIDPDHFSNIDDVKGTQKESRELKRSIDEVIMKGGFEVGWDRIGEVYENYIYWSTTMRVFLVIMSLPLFLLCFYLVLVGSRIGMDAKVQEISLLKVKGAVKGHIFSMLMAESLSHGIIGSLLGIVLGSLLSSVFIGRFLDNNVPFVSLLPSLTMAMVLVIISCLFVILIRLRSTWRLARMNILEAARGSPERKEKRYKATLDIVIVSLIFILIGIMSYFNNNTPSGMGALVVYSVVETIKPILVLFLPFLLILSLSRVLILGIPGTLTLIAKPLKGMNKELQSLLLAGLKFGKRRVAIMAILISISLSFGILVLSQMETREASVENTVHASIPTDVYVVTSGACWPMEGNISNLPGVESVVQARSYVLSGSLEDGRYGGYFWSRAMAFDSAEYSSTVSFSEDLIIEGSGPRMLGSDTSIPGVIINKPFMKEYDASIGDSINLTLDHQWPIGSDDLFYSEFNENYLEAIVIGIVDHMPGLRSDVDRDILDSKLYGYDSLASSDLEEWPCLYIDLSHMPQDIGSETWIYLIDARTEPLAVEEQVNQLNWKGNISAATTKDSELQRIKDIPANKGMDLVLLVQFGCVLVSVVVGLFLLQLVSNASRKREFAEIMSRGATRENIFKLLLSEGIVVLGLGLIIGTGVGLLVGYSFQTVFTGDWTASIGDFGSGIDLENTISVGQGVIFPWTILIIHFVTIISSLVAVTIVSILSTRIDIASNLRLRRS